MYCTQVVKNFFNSRATLLITQIIKKDRLPKQVFCKLRVLMRYGIKLNTF